MKIKLSVVIFCLSNLLYWVTMLMYGGMHITSILIANLAILISMMPLYGNGKNDNENSIADSRFISTFTPVLFASAFFIFVLAEIGIVNNSESCNLSTYYFSIYTFVHAMVFYVTIDRVMEPPGIFDGFITVDGKAKSTDADAGRVILLMILLSPLFIIAMLQDETIYNAFNHFSCIFKLK